MSHKCPVDVCQVQVAHHMLMCGFHWGLVPPFVQQRVYRTWNAGHPLADYPRARQEAIHFANMRSAALIEHQEDNRGDA
jgi:endonuclease I